MIGSLLAPSQRGKAEIGFLAAAILGPCQCSANTLPRDKRVGQGRRIRRSYFAYRLASPLAERRASPTPVSANPAPISWYLPIVSSKNTIAKSPVITWIRKR
ncbi:hypothetical protein BH23CHL4_BH23CHL4_18540 [soil metagenome]